MFFFFFFKLGCGTALTGIVAAKLSFHAFLSDNGQYKNSLFCCKKSCLFNGVFNATIVPITWGRFSPQLLKITPVDIILGSDSFYDKNGNKYFFYFCPLFFSYYMLL